MKAIVAVDTNWAIGNCGQLLCHVPGDLKYFKEKTRGKVVLMGRATYESLPGKKPLPNRVNAVLSRNLEFDAPCCVCHSQEELMETLKGYHGEDVFVIGGESVYRQYLPYCDVVYVTKIQGCFHADTHFPNLDEDQDFQLVWSSGIYKEQGISYQFTEYQRVGKGFHDHEGKQ
jgi:dihydrofolate reductase